MSVSEARAALPRILKLVDAGDEVTLTRHGQPVAVIVRPDALRARRAGAALVAADAVSQALHDARRAPLSASPMLTSERADELVADVRAARSDR